MDATLTLKSAAETYLSDFEFSRRPRSYESAQLIVREFANRFPEKPLTEVDASFVLQHLKMLRDEKRHGNRTLANKFIRLSAFLKRFNVRIPSEHRPRFTPTMPTVYEPCDLSRFLAACTDIRQTALFKTLLMTGIRKEEARWLEWSDLEKGLLHVRAKPPNFLPKTHEERRIPVAKSLWSLLNQMPRRPGTLVFPTASGMPDPHMLRACKRIARRAALDPEKWTLHGFRRTFCTTCLRSGMDLRTVQSLMGHHDVQSTMRYLRPLDAEQLVGRLSEIFG
jgi:integrase/recombinase XerD